MIRDRAHLATAALLLLALAAVAHPLLDRDLHSAEERLLTRLDHLDGGPAVTREFTRAPWREPSPATDLFLRLQQLATPGSFAEVALALHALNTLLLLFFLRRRGLGAWPSGLMAGAFALHPIQIENLAHLAGQGELLATSFVFVALHLHESRRSGLAAEFGLLACLVAGALCSPTALLLPVLLVLVAPDPRAALSARIPLFVASLLLGIFLWSRTSHELATWTALYGFGGHLHHFASAILLSLTDLLAPYRLSPMHVVPSPLPVWVPLVILPLLVLAMRAGARGRTTVTGVVALAATLFFAAVRGVLRFEYRADGWLALAVAALAWTLVARFGGPGRFRKTAALLVLAFWGVLAHAQAGHWVTERALLDHTVGVEPANWEARIARAELEMLSGETRLAEADALAALQEQPGSVAATFILGYTRGVAGDDYALQRLGWHGSRTGWNDRAAGLRLGYLFLEIGLTREAVALLEDAADPDAEAGLALAAARLGDAVDARAHLERALAREPRSDEARLAVAWLLATAPEAELRDANRSLELARKVDAPEYRYLRLDTTAAALARLGRSAEAYRDAQEAARRAEADGYPGRAEEIRDRALVYLGSGAWTEPRASAPAADARVDDQGQEEDHGADDPGDG